MGCKNTLSVSEESNYCLMRSVIPLFMYSIEKGYLCDRGLLKIPFALEPYVQCGVLKQGKLP